MKTSWAAILLAAAGLSVAGPVAGAQSPDPSPADPGPVESLSLAAPGLSNSGLILAGRDAAAQLLITGQLAGGAERDLTRDVTYSASPEGIVGVSPSGWVVPIGEGEAVIRAVAPGGVETTCRVTVTHLIEDLPVNFPNEVVPVFTKSGCNAGGCHGKSGGQNGFQLSLLGFEPAEDFEHLVHESRGRRVFPAAPEESLLLKKATGSVPHGGGHRFDVGSPPYRVLLRWIEQGMPYGNADDPTLAGVEVLPKRRTLARGTGQQLAVVAHYTDGSARDVTRTAQFESNDPGLAEVDETGLVTAGDGCGTAAVMVRYQAAVDVFRATVPYGVEVKDLPAPNNFIDELVFGRLVELGLPPSPSCDDGTFLRRATIDVAGRLPTLEETRAFLADGSPDKRERLVDRLVQSGDYADYFANKWSAVLRNRRDGRDGRYATYAFHDWLRTALYDNVPYDRWVRDVLTASGRAEENPAVAWYDQVRDPTAELEDTAQLFLGRRMQCAKCHHHPFEKWSQDDYYGLAAFFSRVGRKPSSLGGGKDSIYHNVGPASAQNPKTGQNVPPTPLGGKPLEIAPEEDPRGRLVDWMADPENPFFAEALVNRYWKHFFGRGLVEPEDDMRVTNPPSNPELLDALAEHFVESHFDLKDLVRTICTSRVYSLSSEANAYNEKDQQSFSRFYPRRLPAEVMLDAIDAVTGATSRFAGLPDSTRAVELPDNAFDSYFLTVFGRPQSESACECERSSNVNLAQCLHLINSKEVRAKLAGPRIAALAADGGRHEPKLRELYLAAFCREPTADELGALSAHLTKYGDDPKQAYEDVAWAVINTKEFMFNH